MSALQCLWSRAATAFLSFLTFLPLVLAAYTPTAAAGVGHSGRDVFYTPLQPAQNATPVDAWHTILSSLTGDRPASLVRHTWCLLAVRLLHLGTGQVAFHSSCLHMHAACMSVLGHLCPDHIILLLHLAGSSCTCQPFKVARCPSPPPTCMNLEYLSMHACLQAMKATRDMALLHRHANTAALEAAPAWSGNCLAVRHATSQVRLGGQQQHSSSCHHNFTAGPKHQTLLSKLPVAPITATAAKLCWHEPERYTTTAINLTKPYPASVVTCRPCRQQYRQHPTAHSGPDPAPESVSSRCRTSRLGLEPSCDWQAAAAAAATPGPGCAAASRQATLLAGLC
jgi:hypothetical protein